MTHVLWLYAATNPLQSGELRRLGLPALALHDDRWTCTFGSSALAEAYPPADVAILPLAAADALARLQGGAAARVVIEIDLRTAIADPNAALTLSGLANRIAGVVARGARAAAWARQILEDKVPVWIIADPAARRVELAAAALQLGLPIPPARIDGALEGEFELWFAEPGDYIEGDEISQLAKAWRTPGQRRLIVAPRFVRAWAKQAGIEAASVDWTPDVMQSAFAAAERCVFFGPENYAQGRRRVTALRAGAPGTPPTAPRPSTFEPVQVAANWDEVLTAVLSGGSEALSSPPSTVMVFLDLIQDLDPLLPLVDELQGRGSGVRLRLLVSNWVRRRSPRVGAELQSRGLSFESLDRAAVLQGGSPSLQGVDAVIAVAESSLAAHAPAHALFARARAAGVPTFALQHGVENVGLHHVAGEDDATVAADHLFVWFPPDRTPASVPAPLRPRLVHVGRAPPVTPSPEHIGGILATFDSVLAVFENLHWRRFDAAWRSRFLADCTELAFSDPSRAVILKPHHAGLWSVKNRHLIPQWPSNLIVADPTDPFWEPFTAGALVQLADYIVTTPSTVALDAAQAGKPVAVAAYGLDLSVYAPLPLLHNLEDWFSFLGQAGSVEDARRRAAFVTRTAQGDDPAGAAADYILGAVRARRRRGLTQAATGDR